MPLPVIQVGPLPSATAPRARFPLRALPPFFVVLAAAATLFAAAAAGDAHAAKKKKPGGGKKPDTAAPASAVPEVDKEKEAKRHFDSGNLFYESGDYLAAAAEFLVAYELVPKASLLYNAGRAYEEAKDAGKAVEMYRRYLKAGSDVTNRDEVEDRVKKLSSSGNRTVTITTKPDGASIWVDLRAGSGAKTPYTVSLEMGAHKLFIEKKGYRDVTNEFTVSEDSEGTVVEIELSAVRGFVAVEAPDGAEVFVDGERVGTTPLAPVVVAAGTHEVLVRAPGTEGTFREIEVTEGETIVVRGAGGGSPLTYAGIGLMGVGVAAGVTSGVFGFLALSTHSVLRNCADFAICTMSETETTLSIARGKRNALIADIAWMGAAVLAGTGVVLFVLSLGGKKAAPRDDYAGGPRLRVDAFGLGPVPGGGALTLAGGF